MGTMVAVDAFSQALTNPLLAKSVFNASTFSRAGMRAIKRTSRLQDLVARNTPGEDTEPLVTFTRTSSTATR
jgi:prostaglandin-endoperoxide synthase 2